jgi:hypothetical protein
MNARIAAAGMVAIVALVGCSVHESSSGDVNKDTSHANVDVGTTTDTISVPTLGIEKDTVVVSKPVVTGQKKIEVTRPTVNVRKP